MASTNDIGKALQSLRPGAQWTLPDANTLATLVWPGQAQTRPTDQEIMDKVAALGAEQDPARADSFRLDAGRIDLMTRLKTATPAQIDTWVEANVTTLAQARTVLKAMIKTIALDMRT